MYKPNDSVVATFTTSKFSTGAAFDASSISGTLVRNGTDDGGVTVTITNKATGSYKAAFTIPNTYAVGDTVELRIEATVDSVDGKNVVWSCVLDGKRNADLNDLAAGDAMTLHSDYDAAKSAASQATVNAIKTKTDNLPNDPASDTQVNTRLATVSYTAPDNAGIAAVKAKTDNLPNDPASNTQVNTRMAAGDYTAPDNLGIATAAAQALTAASNTATLLARITATLFTGITSLAHWLRTLARKSAPDATALAEINTGGGAFDAAKHSLEQTGDEYTAPDNAGIAAASAAAAAAQAASEAAETAAAQALTAVEALPDADAIDAKLTSSHGAGSWREGAGSAGDGAYTITVTVTDDSQVPQALENTTVRFTSGAITYTARTDASGVCTLNADAGDWTVAATRAGYQFAGTVHTVSGDGTLAIVMTAIVLGLPSDPRLTRAYGITRDPQGNVEASVLVEVELLVPVGQGLFARTRLTATSDANGLVSFDLLRLATYQVRRTGGAIGWRRFTTLDADTCELPTI